MNGIRQFFDDSYRVSHLVAASWSTIETYRASIAQFSASLGHAAQLDDFTDVNLSRHVDWVIASGRSSSTAVKHLRHLLPIWKAAYQRGLVERPPMLKIPKPIKRLPRAWDPREVGQIIAAAKLEPGYVGPIPAGEFWEALIHYVYDVGSRKSVTLRLAPSDFDLERRLVRLPAHLQKTRVEQVLMFSRRTADKLRAIAEPADREFMFCWPHDRYQRSTWTSFNRRLRRIVERAGLDTSHGLLQRLRRTCATQFEILEPGSATARLGHSSPLVAKNHYIDATHLPASDTVERIASPVEPAPSLRLFG